MSAKDTRTFFLDTNVFVAAVKRPEKETAALSLILVLLEAEDLELVGNDLLAEEMVRYAEEFRSETASWLIGALLKKTRFVQVERTFRAACRRYITTPDPADLLHAATCLQESAVLISNDKHFSRLAEAGIVEVWTVARAVVFFNASLRRRE